MRVRWVILYLVAVVVLGWVLAAGLAIVHVLATGEGDCYSADCSFLGDFIQDEWWFIVFAFAAISALVLWPAFHHRLRNPMRR